MTQQKSVTIGGGDVPSISFHNDRPFVLIAGPCAIESRNHALDVGYALKELTTSLKIPFIYKSSFDKANRMSGRTPRGLGMAEGLPILAEIRSTLNVPVITDIHTEDQCEPVADVVDILQIPAFLCRQTDLLAAAARTGKALHVKKGQFLAPWDMGNVAKKLEDFGCSKVLLCERGVSFGYNTLVSDMRSIPIMKASGYPVVFDATHSVQQPGGGGDKSGGQREFVPILARAAIAIGVAGVFMETHDNPDRAPSDGPNMVPLKDMGAILRDLQAFDTLAKQNPCYLPNAHP